MYTPTHTHTRIHSLPHLIWLFLSVGAPAVASNQQPACQLRITLERLLLLSSPVPSQFCCKLFHHHLHYLLLFLLLHQLLLGAFRIFYIIYYLYYQRYLLLLLLPLFIYLFLFCSNFSALSREPASHHFFLFSSCHSECF